MRRRFFVLASSLLLAPLALAPRAAAQGWLDTARWYVPTQAGEFHYLADFNADGFDDLVWFSGVPGSPTDWTSFQVWFNDGTGQFPVHGPVTALPVSPNFFRPIDVNGVRRLKDVTGDGLVDVLVLEETPSFTTDVALQVYPGLGGGAFGAPIAIPAAGDFESFALGQIDGDPAYELAIVDEVSHSEHTRWYDWNGAGFTASAEAFIFGGIVSPQPSFMVALDLDQDGDDDLVFGQASGLNLRVLNTVNGAPVLGQILTVGGADGESVYPYLADLPGGGPVDLLVADVTFGGAAFWLVPVLNQGGTLVAGARQPFTGGAAVNGQEFEPCDWDGDGDTDVVAFAWQEPGSSVDPIAAFFRNNGGSWGLGPISRVNMGYAGGQTGLGATDLDHDGHLDYLGPQSIFFGRGRFETTPTVVTSTFFGADAALVTDAEGDGDLDEYLKQGGVRLNDATGSFPATMFMPAPPAGKQSNGYTAIGDLTGDGLPDFVEQIFNPPIDIFHPATFDSMRLVRDDGLGHFVDGGTANTANMQPYNKQTSFVFDFDDDGDNDVWSNPPGWWPNDGTGHFGAVVPLGSPGTDVSAAGDLDGDGDADLVAVAWPPQLLSFTHTPPAGYVSHLIYEDPFGMDADSVTLADLDADGDLDLCAATAFSESLLLFANDGAGGFAQTDTLSTNVSTSNDPVLSAHAFQDVDGDGVIDLLAGPKGQTSSFPDKVALFRGLPGGGYEPARWYVGAGMGRAGDVDGDGDLDLMGRSIVRSRLFDGPADGIIRQYGAGTPALSEVSPVLGAAGPLRPGSATASMRVSRAVGGKLALLLYGLGEAAVPGQPFVDSTLYVQPPFNTLLLVLDGPVGVHGKGSLNLGLTPVLPAVVGITVFHQLAVFGGPGNGKSTSNGLQLTYGF
jgi:FG-GAP-like repeat